MNRWVIFAIFLASVSHGLCQEATEPEGCREWPVEKTTTSSPAGISVYGHLPLIFGEACFAEATEVTCTFNDLKVGAIEVEGHIIDGRICCIAPFFYQTGRVEVDISVQGGGKTGQYKSHIWVVKDKHPNVMGVEAILDGKSPGVYFNWNAADFPAVSSASEMYNLDLDIHVLQRDGKFEKILGEDGESFSEVYIRPGWHATEHMVSTKRLLQEMKGKLDGVFIFTLKIRDDKTCHPILVTPVQLSMQIWKFIPGSKLEPEVVCDMSPYGSTPFDVLPCPPTLKKAELDCRFPEHTYAKEGTSSLPFYHPEADKCFVSKERFNPNDTYSGQECCYKSDGYIICGYESASGRPHRYSPETHLFYHFLYDIVPWLHCCYIHGDDSNECQNYFKHREPDCGGEYEPPSSALCWGDPHHTTFDGIQFNFQGFGEYWLFKNKKCGGQVRQRPGSHLLHPEMNGSVAATGDWTVTLQQAFVFACDKKDSPVVQVQISDDRTRLELYMNNELITVGDTWTSLSWGEMTVEKERSNRIVVSFQEMMFPIDLQFYQRGGTVAYLDVTPSITSKKDPDLPGPGILGGCDHDKTNDLETRNGTILPHDSSEKTIYHEFGEPWRVTKEESLFMYPTYLGQSWETYNPQGFDALVTVPEASADIIDFCKNNTQCIIDVVQGGSHELGNQTLNTQEEFEKTQEELNKKTPVCPRLPNLENGHYKLTGGLLVGAKATPVCKSDYTLVGRKELVCEETELWSLHCGSIPICVSTVVANMEEKKFCDFELDTCYAHASTGPPGQKDPFQCYTAPDNRNKGSLSPFLSGLPLGGTNPGTNNKIKRK